MIVKKNKYNFNDWILDLKPSVGKVLFLMIPPFNALWLLAIGKRLQKAENDSNVVFNVVATINVILFLSTWSFPILHLYLSTAPPTMPFPISLLIFSFWFLTNGLLSYMTIKFERSSETEKFFGTKSNIDYIRRFFAFVYYPFFLFKIQEKIKYYKQAL